MSFDAKGRPPSARQHAAPLMPSLPRMQSGASHGPDGVERSAEPAGAANRTCAGEEEWRYGALQERVLDDDAPGCTNEVGVSHHTSGHAAGDRSPLAGQRAGLRERHRVPRPARGLATLAPIRGENRRFQRRLPRAYARSSDGHPGRHRIGRRCWAGQRDSLNQQSPDLLNVGRQWRQVVQRDEPATRPMLVRSV